MNGGQLEIQEKAAGITQTDSSDAEEVGWASNLQYILPHKDEDWRQTNLRADEQS